MQDSLLKNKMDTNLKDHSVAFDEISYLANTLQK